MYIKKFISLFITVCMSISFICGDIFAAYIVPKVEINGYDQVNNKFILPASLGKITEAHFAATDRIIINIQDLHCHPKVQKNISNIIEMIDKEIPVSNIYMEGAYGDIDVSWLIKIKKLLGNSAVDKVLDTGRITGAEYYCALNERNNLIKGLEKKEEYLANIKRFGTILNNREKISVILNSVSETTDKLKKNYYDRRQLKIDEISKQYNEGNITAEKYFSLLVKNTKKLNIDIKKYKNIYGYINLLLLQKELNYPKITRQLKLLLSVLKKRIPTDKYLFLSKVSGNFSKIDVLYEYLIDITDEYNIDLSKEFKDLNNYFRYIKLSGSVNPLEVIEEDKLLANEINLRFSNTKAQREVLFLSGFERYLKDFLNAKITETNYVYFKNNFERYKQLWNKYVDNKVLNLLEEYIEQNNIFYDVNEQRNNYFSDNIFTDIYNTSSISNVAVKTNNDVEDIINNLKYVKRVDIIVTGGFHTGTVSNLLKEKNVSYIVITPKIKEGVNLAENTYYSIIKEQSIIQTQTIAKILDSVVENNIDSKIRVLLEAGVSDDNIKNILSVTNDEINKVKNDNKNNETKDLFNKDEFIKIVKIAELLDDVDSSSDFIGILKDFLFVYIDDDSIREEIDSDLILNYLDLDAIKKDITSTETVVKEAVEKRHFKKDTTVVKLYKIFIKLFEKLPARFISDKIINKLQEQITKNEVKQIFNKHYGYLGKIHAVKPLSGGFHDKVPMKIVVINDKKEKESFVLKPIERSYIDLKRNPDIIADGISFAEQNNLPTSKLYQTKDGKNFIEIGNYFYMLNEFAQGKAVEGNKLKDIHITNIASSMADTHNKFRKNKTEQYEDKDVKDWNIDEDINPKLFDFSENTVDEKLKELNIWELTQDLNLNDEEKKYILYFNHLWKDEEILREFLKSEDERTVKFLIEQSKKVRQIWNSIDEKGKDEYLETLYIHGDWNIENIFFDGNNKITSLIDWEQYGKTYRIMDFYRFFADTRYVNLFDIDTFLYFLLEYQNKSDKPLNEEELNVLLALMNFGFISRAKYIVNRSDKDNFYYNIKNFDDFFSENNINDILKLDKKELGDILSKVIRYQKKNMREINKLKRAIKNNENISISFVCLLNRHRSASTHIMFEYYLKNAGKDNIKINSFGIIPLVSFVGRFVEHIQNNKFIKKIFNIVYNEDMESELKNFINEKEKDGTFNERIFDEIEVKPENVTKEYANADYIVATSKVQKMLLQILLGKSANIILFSDISIVMPDNSNLADPGRSHIGMEQMLNVIYSSVKYLISGQKDTGYLEYDEVVNNNYGNSLDNIVEGIVFGIFWMMNVIRSFISRLNNVSMSLLNSKADFIEPADLFLIENEIWKEDLRRKNYNVATVGVINGEDEKNKYYDWKSYNKTDINIEYDNGYTKTLFRVYVKYDGDKIDDVVFYSRNKVENFDFEQLKKKLQQKKQEGFTSEYFTNVNNFIFAEGVTAEQLEADMINKMKVNITHNSFVQAIEGVLNISNEDEFYYIEHAVTDAVSNNMSVIVINEKQLKNNKFKIEYMKKKYGLKFVLSETTYNNMLDGNRIDATSMNYEQATELLKNISGYEFINVSSRMSVTLNDDVLSKFENEGIDIFQKYGVIPIVNTNNINKYSGKIEFEINHDDLEKIDSDKISEILSENDNIISLSVDDVSVLHTDNGTDGISEKIKDLQNNKNNYKKGLIAMLKSEFVDDFIMEDVGLLNKSFFDKNEFLKDMLKNDFTGDSDDNIVKINKFINLLQNSDFFNELPEATKMYLNNLMDDNKYTQVIGAVRGILLNTVEKQFVGELKNNNIINISVADFRNNLEYDSRLALLTLKLSLIIDGKQKENLDFIEETVDDVKKNVNSMIRKIVRENDFKIEPLSKDLLKNYAIIEEVLIDSLRDFEVKPEIQTSIQNLKSVFAAA